MAQKRGGRASAPETARFHEGELALLRDRRGRRYRLRLSAGVQFYTHLGSVPHDDIIGTHDGSYVVTNKGHRLLALRPTLLEAVLEMPRHSQVIYPKDLATILIRGDIYPGATVVEIGLGTGATAATLLRAVGPDGHVVSYEVRPEVAQGACNNIADLLPDVSNHTVRLRDAVAEGIEERGVDRVVADIPEPWLLTPTVTEALRTGGIFLSFLPTVPQVHELGRQLIHDPHYHLVETVETLERPWRISDRSIRPADRMVGHTGFITTARRCEPSPENATSPDGALQNGSDGTTA